VYTVDAQSAVIQFGDGLHGKRPPLGAAILASYAYGGGRAGNLGVGALKTSPILPAGFKVANPLPTWGGADGESVTDAERDIPLVLRNANRAVSADDFRDIVARTPGIDLGRREVLPLFHPDLGSPSPGVVTVLVIPVDDAHPEAPVPNQFFLQAVCNWLEPRRVLTTEVHVRGPDYVGVSVSVGVDVVAGLETSTVREAVKAAVRTFLSPLAGGVSKLGWPLDKNVEQGELLVSAARVDGVASVRDLRLWDSSGAEQTQISISGLQLPRLDRLTVAIGDAEDLAAAPPAPAKRRLPVPVVPVEC
jgi:predicted phage baseplate assembly protein